MFFFFLQLPFLKPLYCLSLLINVFLHCNNGWHGGWWILAFFNGPCILQSAECFWVLNILLYRLYDDLVSVESCLHSFRKKYCFPFTFSQIWVLCPFTKWLNPVVVRTHIGFYFLSMAYVVAICDFVYWIVMLLCSFCVCNCYQIYHCR